MNDDNGGSLSPVIFICGSFWLAVCVIAAAVLFLLTGCSAVPTPAPTKTPAIMPADVRPMRVILAPTATEQNQLTCWVENSANLREGPGMTYAVIDTATNESLIVAGGLDDGDGWIIVTVDGRDLYIHGKLCKLNGGGE